VSALILGTLIAAMRISPVASLRAFAAFWVEIARNTPLTLVFIFTAFVLPMLGVRAPYMILAFLALTYYTSPFIAEALRSGINGVPIGQAEAARSIGLGFGQTVSLVVLPQAFRMTVPPLINVFIALTKNTSVAGGFFVVELFATTRSSRTTTATSCCRSCSRRPRSTSSSPIPLGFFAGQLERAGWCADDRQRACCSMRRDRGRADLADPVDRGPAADRRRRLLDLHSARSSPRFWRESLSSQTAPSRTNAAARLSGSMVSTPLEAALHQAA
jgi:glutamate transport system permease protein